MKFDIIGDIHGHAKQLRELLGKLGYSDKKGHYRHSESDRKAIFVGDFIDRGPRIRETLSIVSLMTENDAAYAVMGNHEYNALCFHTKTAGQTNSWLRPRTNKNITQHLETLYQFKDHQDEWKNYLAWFMSLPLFLDLGDIRVVHAAWIPAEIEKIKKWTSDSHKLSKSLIQKSAIEGFDEFDTIEKVLKGVEIPLPKGQTFNDKDNNIRKEIRIRWWEEATNKTYGEMIFPKKTLKYGKQKINQKETDRITVYKDSVPTFFGHYWCKPGKHEIRIQTDHICCLDYSVAKGGSLVAYRWEGEKKLENDRLIWV